MNFYNECAEFQRRIAALEAENTELEHKHLEALRAEKDWAQLYSNAMDERDKLQAENAELKEQLEYTIKEDAWEKTIETITAERDKLQARVKALDVAGDAMVDGYGYTGFQERIANWQKAKNA